MMFKELLAGFVLVASFVQKCHGISVDDSDGAVSVSSSSGTKVVLAYGPVRNPSFCEGVANKAFWKHNVLPGRNLNACKEACKANRWMNYPGSNTWGQCIGIGWSSDKVFCYGISSKWSCGWKTGHHHRNWFTQMKVVTYTDTGTKVCAGTRTAYWDNRESQQHRFQNGAILNPLFKKGNGNRVELDNACRTLCSKDATCGGYAIATDRFWRTSHWGHPHNYVCALYGDCKASKAENGNYHGFQKQAL